jgi:uncharacterized SAM-binding protein YcdF (DUF218 family)
MQKPTFDHELDEKPLDPAAERVRRNLMRFVVINIGILLAAVMAVLGAVVYKSGVFSSQSPQATTNASVPSSADMPFVEGIITLPAGARVVSQALSGDRLTLHAELPGGTTAIYHYDLVQRRMLGRYVIAE